MAVDTEVMAEIPCPVVKLHENRC